MVLMNPGSLEDELNSTAKTFLNPDIILASINDKSPSIAPGIPKTKIPDYAINGFNYVSATDGIKQWKLVADKAHLYNEERLVHGKKAQALLYDSKGEATLITGLEARYFLNQKDLEIFGSARTTFPDGFVIESEYVRYLPQERKLFIPIEYVVRGKGIVENQKQLSFTSLGMEYDLNKQEINLSKEVHLNLLKTESATATNKSKTEETKISSDFATIFRSTKLAHFKMFNDRPAQEKFATLTQPGLFVKSRWISMNYGDSSNAFNYVTAYDDVYMEELSQETIYRYATCGQADFDAKKNDIQLTKFPQVYQDNDTVTGDSILIHRDTDIVEVERGNAYNEGDKR
jgi:LPS export ABC transporter protein LptC